MTENNLITIEQITTKTYHIRGAKIMLDRDLAEFDNLKSQFVISSWGGIRKMPLAFTEQGF